jgi:hypothetical protein
MAKNKGATEEATRQTRAGNKRGQPAVVGKPPKDRLKPPVETPLRQSPRRASKQTPVASVTGQKRV